MPPSLQTFCRTSTGKHAHQEGRLLDSNRVLQGDNLGPNLFRRSYDAATQEWNEQLGARPWARRHVVLNIPKRLPEASIDLSLSGYADDLARAAVAKNQKKLGQMKREQTDNLRAALKSRPFSPAPSYERNCSFTCRVPQLHEGPPSGLHWSMASSRTHQLAGKVSWSASHG